MSIKGLVASLVLGVGLVAEARVAVPKPFLWGVSNSAFQVEGTPADSDWRRWTLQPGKIKDGTAADRATDFWNRFPEDARLAQEGGLNAFRMSVAWERIQPGPDRWDEAALAHYEKMIVELRRRGLEPVVTLQHFALPGWLADRGGLLAAEFVPKFARYAVTVVSRLSRPPARVKYWMTINEPMILVRGAYLEGDWPPGIRNPKLAMMAAGALAKAHLEAVREIRGRCGAGPWVSIAKNWQVFQAADGNPLSLVAAEQLEYLFNKQFMNAALKGEIAFWMPGLPQPTVEKVPLPGGRAAMDYLGINNYGRWLVSHSAEPPGFKLAEGPGPKSDMGWEIFPEALYRALKHAAGYGLPILVSENGVADRSDALRGKFLEEHLAWIARARREGIPVFGYLYWSLTDNFEWAHGLAPRFGLVEMDYETLERKPRASYYRFRDLVSRYREEFKD